MDAPLPYMHSCESQLDQKSEQQFQSIHSVPSIAASCNLFERLGPVPFMIYLSG